MLAVGPVALRQVELQLVEVLPTVQLLAAQAAVLQMVTPTAELAETLLAALEQEQAALVVQAVVQGIPLLTVVPVAHQLL